MELRPHLKIIKVAKILSQKTTLFTFAPTIFSQCCKPINVSEVISLFNTGFWVINSLSNNYRKRWRN